MCLKYILITLFKIHYKYANCTTRLYEDLLQQGKKKQAAELMKYYEGELCIFLIARASRNLTKYTDDDLGFLGQFPMDILHTISKGTVPLLIEILDGYIEQSTAKDTGGGKQKKKKRTKSAKRLGTLNLLIMYFKDHI